jgi:lactoylglutathione lyase
MTQLRMDVHAGELRLKRVRPDQRKGMQRQWNVVEGDPDEPHTQQSAKKAPLGREESDSESATTEYAKEELDQDDPPSPADTGRSPHVDCGESAHVQPDGHDGMISRAGEVLRGRLPLVSDGRMRLRIELFVEDLDVSVTFYRDVLGFQVVRRTDDYVSIRHGAVVLGVGPVAKLPEHTDGPGFSRRRLDIDKGAGVEIVLEVDSVEELSALHEHCQARGTVVEELQQRPWGLRDFRLVDPDGYYLRITHGDAAASDSA